MILVDSSIWVDHLRSPIEALRNLLERNQVLGHPHVTGEIAMGSFHRRERILFVLENLPQSRLASDHDVVRFVSRNSLFGLGIGYVDAHLLVATGLTSEALFWTRDLRLRKISDAFGLAYHPA